MHLWEYESATLEHLQQESMKIRDLLGKVKPGTPMYHQLLIHLETADREYFEKKNVSIMKEKIKREEKEAARKTEIEIGVTNSWQDQIKEVAKHHLSSKNRRKLNIARAAVLVGEHYADQVHGIAVDYIKKPE